MKKRIHRLSSVFYLVVLIVVFVLVFIFGIIHETLGRNQIIDLAGSNEFELVSDVLTYDEMIARYAENANISLEEALRYFSKDLSADVGVTYRELKTELEVASGYTPCMVFFCKTDEASEEWTIVSVCSMQMITNSNGKCKDFNGNLEVWLRTSTQIEYAINGDFVNNGNPVKGCMENSEVEMGGTLKRTFIESSASKTFKYFYEHVFYNIR